MVTKAEEAERKKVEAAVRGAAGDGKFVCPECRKPAKVVVLNPEYGYICGGCDWVIKLVD